MPLFWVFIYFGELLVSPETYGKSCEYFSPVNLPVSIFVLFKFKIQSEILECICHVSLFSYNLEMLLSFFFFYFFIKLTVFKNHGSVFYGLSHNLNFMIACPFVLNPVSEPFLPPPLLVYQWSQLMVISSLFFNSSLKTFDTIDHFLKHLFPLASGTILSLAFPSALCLLLLCLLC